MKLLFWLLIAALVVAWYMRGKSLASHSGGRGRGAAGAQADRLGRPEEMLACARCQLHVPASEALFDLAGRPYCCEQHFRLGAGG
ncbi:uncharacterized protein SAMN06265795_101602 [Noviherbaspirillum humi]|uniref:Uncharacterized protein n=1 Tax=Noviherbaspirillum humi TaxID=1688639 RepID=A0A239CRV4_9BURK|nr:PP0621 family protein [Noviherbaspirillum humi]SNS22498.1 uncharacterized protein SAMN06265795_101602 [Noviherbaspirillum humi]